MQDAGRFSQGPCIYRGALLRKARRAVFFKVRFQLESHSGLPFVSSKVVEIQDLTYLHVLVVRQGRFFFANFPFLGAKCSQFACSCAA